MNNNEWNTLHSKRIVDAVEVYRASKMDNFYASDIQQLASMSKSKFDLIVNSFAAGYIIGRGDKDGK